MEILWCLIFYAFVVLKYIYFAFSMKFILTQSTELAVLLFPYLEYIFFVFWLLLWILRSYSYFYCCSLLPTYLSGFPCLYLLKIETKRVLDIILSVYLFLVFIFSRIFPVLQPIISFGNFPPFSLQILSLSLFSHFLELQLYIHLIFSLYLLCPGDFDSFFHLFIAPSFLCIFIFLFTISLFSSVKFSAKLIWVLYFIYILFLEFLFLIFNMFWLFVKLIHLVT